MSESYSLDRFATYLDEFIRRAKDARREVDEIQVAFNSAYVEWKAEHDAALERLTESILGQLESVGPALQTQISARLPVEKEEIEKRRQELRQTILPETQAETDRLLIQGQEQLQALRELNPEQDQHEEALKTEITALEARLEDLNQRIRRHSGCLRILFNFLTIIKLDRRRNQVIGELRVLQRNLQDVRQTWKNLSEENAAEQQALGGQWRERTLLLGQLQAELAHLDDPEARAQLAQRRAVRHVVDHLKEPIACPIDELKAGLDHMLDLNLHTDAYEESFTPIVGLLGTLEGIQRGLTSFQESVAGILSEQKMHSAYLRMPSIRIPPEIQDMDRTWDDIRNLLQDEAHHKGQPAEFVTLIHPVLDDKLAAQRVERMFEALGKALNQATSSWKG